MAISESQNLDVQMFSPVQIRTEKAITFVRKRTSSFEKKRKETEEKLYNPESIRAAGSVCERAPRLGKVVVTCGRSPTLQLRSQSS